MNIRLVLLLCCLPVRSGANATWTVPPSTPPVQIELEGSVEISRASVTTIRTGSPDAIVSWMGSDGKQAAFGEELMRLDCSGLHREYLALMEKLAVLHQSGSNQLHSLEKDLQEAEEDLAVRLEDLTVKEAEARAAAEPDPSQIATLQREIDLIQREARLQEAELRRKRNLFELGELARFEIEDAELMVAATRRSIRVAELTLKEAEDGSDPVLARRAQWQVQRARLSLGANLEGEVTEERGYGKKIAAIRKNIARRRATIAQNIKALKTEIQGIAKAGWAHLPVQQLIIHKGEQVVHEWQGTNAPFAAVYHAERGYGWIDQAPVTAPSTQALVVRGHAHWRCDLAPGNYTLTFVLGDNAEWNCMNVRHAERPLVAENRLEARQSKTVAADVTVGADGLLLEIGREQKAVLASAAGTVKYQTWIGLARPIHNNPPALYLTPAARLLVRFRVHHLQLPFFENNDHVTRRLELRDSTGAWVPGGSIKITDDPVAFFPSNDDNDLNGGDDEPEERTAREITVTIPPEHSDGFPFAAHVTCRVYAEPKANAIAAPAFLVHEGEEGLFVQRNRERVTVHGSRYDQHFILHEGVAPGDALSVPEITDREAGANRFTGEVVAGTAVPMVVPTRSWARIADMVPHGSRVKEGDLVLTLYRPKENEHSVYAHAKAVAAETRFLEAVDAQQASFLRETGAHAQSVQEEKLAADRVAENRRQDEAILASAEESKRSTLEQLQVLNHRVERLAGKESTRLEYENYKRRRDILQLEALKEQLNAVSTFRQDDYPTQLGDRYAWHQARKELAVREAKLDLSIKQEEVLSQKARSLLEDDLEDEHTSRDFETLRFMHAPADGHVFYLKGYNDLAKRNERIDKEFVVWNGLTVAEILDMSNLTFKISLPESHYHSIRSGMELPIELEDLGDRLLAGTVINKGRTLYLPREQQRSENEAISLKRLFDVTLSFSAPEDLHDLLRPGLRGAVTLP